MKRLIKNGFVVSDMVEIDRPADILIEDDKIVEVGYDINCEEMCIRDRLNTACIKQYFYNCTCKFRHFQRYKRRAQTQ